MRGLVHAGFAIFLGCGGTPAPEILAVSDSGRISAIAPAGPDLYWGVMNNGIDSCDGAFFRTHVASGVTTNLASGCVASITVDSTEVRWSTLPGCCFVGGDLWAMQLDGSTPVKRATGINFYGAAAGPGGTYVGAGWRDGGSGLDEVGILVYPVDGGSPSVLATAGDAGGRVFHEVPVAVATDATHVYWVDDIWGDGIPFGQVDGSLVSVPFTGGSPTVLVSGQNPYALAVDSASLYWTNPDQVDGKGGSLVKIPLGGGTPVVLASGLSGPSGLTVAGSFVYWTNTGGAFHGIGSLMKIPVSGGKPTTVKTGLSFDTAFGVIVPPGPVAFDGTYVYFADSSTIYRLRE